MRRLDTILGPKLWKQWERDRKRGGGEHLALITKFDAGFGRMFIYSERGTVIKIVAKQLWDLITAQKPEVLGRNALLFLVCC